MIVIMLIPVALDLIGAELTLVGEISIPASGVFTFFWEIDEFGNNALMRTTRETQTKDLTITAPEFLNHLLHLKARSGSSFENEIKKWSFLDDDR